MRSSLSDPVQEGNGGEGRQGEETLLVHRAALWSLEDVVLLLGRMSKGCYPVSSALALVLLPSG